MSGISTWIYKIRCACFRNVVPRLLGEADIDVRRWDSGSFDVDFELVATVGDGEMGFWILTSSLCGESPSHGTFIVSFKCRASADQSLFILARVVTWIFTLENENYDQTHVFFIWKWKEILLFQLLELADGWITVRWRDLKRTYRAIVAQGDALKRVGRSDGMWSVVNFLWCRRCLRCSVSAYLEMCSSKMLKQYFRN